VATQALTNTGRRMSKEILLLYALCGALTFGLVGACALAWVIFHPRLAYFVTACGTGVTQAGDMSDGFVFQFAEKAVADRYNWSYLDKEINAAHLRFKEYLHPDALKHFEDKVIPAEKASAKQFELTSMVVPTKTTILRREGYQRLVRVQGIRHLWTKGVLDHQDIVIDMALVPLLESGIPSALRVWKWDDDQPLPKKQR